MSQNAVYEREWAELLEGFTQDLLDRGRRDSTVVAYLSELGRFATWMSERRAPAASAQPLDIRAYVRHMRSVRQVGPRSVARHLTSLRSFYGWLLREGVVAANPAAAVENPRYRKPLPQVLTPQQLATLLELPRRRGSSELRLRDSALLKTLAWTGLRLSEVWALDWDHLDLSRGRATVRVVDGKGGRDRVVPVVEPLCVELLGYLQVTLPLGGMRAVWRSQGGGRLSRRQISDVVRQYGQRMGVRLSPHRLRAQCGVDMIRSGGASLAEVRAVLGHAGYDTLVPYTTVAAVEARGSLDRMVQSPRGRGARG